MNEKARMAELVADGLYNAMRALEREEASGWAGANREALIDELQQWARLYDAGVAKYDSPAAQS